MTIVAIHDTSTAPDDALGTPDSSDVSYPSASFVTDRQPSADRPTEVLVQVNVEGSGGTKGRVQVEIDDDGDGTLDRSIQLSTQAFGLASNPDVKAQMPCTFTLPAGGQYSLTNAQDPNGANDVEDIREVTL